MVVRVLIVASGLNNALLMPLAGPLGAAGLVMIAASGVLFVRYGRGSEEHPQLVMKSPFDLGTTLKLAGLIAVISLFAKVISTSAGDAGITILAAFSGIADVDAITLSLARLANGGITVATAALGIGIAAAVNTAVKAGMTLSLGGAQAGWIVSAARAAAIAAGGVAFALFG
jgi:uncharacterized membrane protein (DUF4010 family)